MANKSKIPGVQDIVTSIRLIKVRYLICKILIYEYSANESKTLDMKDPWYIVYTIELYYTSGNSLISPCDGRRWSIIKRQITRISRKAICSNPYYHQGLKSESCSLIKNSYSVFSRAVKAGQTVQLELKLEAPNLLWCSLNRRSEWRSNTLSKARVTF